MRAIVIIFSFAISACAQLEVITPNPRVEPPETRGEPLKWKIGGTHSSSHRYKATEDAGRRPPDLDNPEVTGHYDFGPATYLSLANPIDIGAEWNILGGGMSLMAKWQVLGDGTLQAKKGNVPIALFARAGQVRGDKSGDQNGTFGPGGYPWKGKAKTDFVQAGLSGGYRATDYLLVYGGVAAGKYWTDIEIVQDRSNNGSDAGGTYKKDATGDGLGVAAGVMFSWRKFQFYVAGERTTIDYNDSNVEEQLSVNGGVFFTP